MEHSWANTGFKHIATDLWWEVSGGQDRQKFPELSPSHTAPGGDHAVTASTGAQHITKVAKLGLHIKHSAINFHFCHGSAINGLCQALKPRADVIGVDHQCLSEATKLLTEHCEHRMEMPVVNDLGARECRFAFNKIPSISCTQNGICQLMCSRKTLKICFNDLIPILIWTSRWILAIRGRQKDQFTCVLAQRTRILDSGHMSSN